MNPGRFIRRVGGSLGIALLGSLLWSGVAQGATATFNFTGAEQTFVVPNGVTAIHVDAVGGRGGMGDGGAVGGFGAHATADLPVTAGQVLFVLVGGNGNAGQEMANTSAGGFNGGGLGGASGGGACRGAGSGGGASDVRTT